jgi:ABC-2 type transport system permease protein
MPGWIQSISRYNPVDWGVTAARNAVVHGNAWGQSVAHLGFLLATAVVTALFATWCFRSYQRSI